MFQKGKSARITNKIGAFVLIIAAGAVHRLKRLTKGVFDLKSVEKALKQGDFIPESIQRLFRDEEPQKVKEVLTKTMNFEEDEDLLNSSTLRNMYRMDNYNHNLRKYETYRKYTVFIRFFRKQ
jgi:hypothetical protein